MRSLAVAAFILLSFVPTAFADPATPPAGQGNSNPPAGLGNPQPQGESVRLMNPLGSDSLMSFLGSILNFIIQIGAIAVVLMLVYVGYLFVKARGNQEELVGARRALLWTLVGALILLGAKAIALGICQTAQALSSGGGSCGSL